MAKKNGNGLAAPTDDSRPSVPIDWVALTQAIFAGLKDLLVVAASVATVYFQAQFGAKQDLSLARQEVVMAKQDVAAEKADEVKKALDKSMEP